MHYLRGGSCFSSYLGYSMGLKVWADGCKKMETISTRAQFIDLSILDNLSVGKSLCYHWQILLNVPLRFFDDERR